MDTLYAVATVAAFALIGIILHAAFSGSLAYTGYLMNFSRT